MPQDFSFRKSSTSQQFEYVAVAVLQEIGKVRKRVTPVPVTPSDMITNVASPSTTPMSSTTVTSSPVGKTKTSASVSLHVSATPGRPQQRNKLSVSSMLSRSFSNASGSDRTGQATAASSTEVQVSFDSDSNSSSRAAKLQRIENLVEPENESQVQRRMFRFPEELPPVPLFQERGNLMLTVGAHTEGHSDSKATAAVSWIHEFGERSTSILSIYWHYGVDSRDR